VLVEVNSETDFVARDENFLAFVEQVLDAAFDASARPTSPP
jgi:elongation factor Ts